MRGSWKNHPAYQRIRRILAVVCLALVIPYALLSVSLVVGMVRLHRLGAKPGRVVPLLLGTSIRAVVGEHRVDMFCEGLSVFEPMHCGVVRVDEQVITCIRLGTGGFVAPDKYAPVQLFVDPYNPDRTMDSIVLFAQSSELMEASRCRAGSLTRQHELPMDSLDSPIWLVMLSVIAMVPIDAIAFWVTLAVPWDGPLV